MNQTLYHMALSSLTSPYGDLSLTFKDLQRMTQCSKSAVHRELRMLVQCNLIHTTRLGLRRRYNLIHARAQDTQEYKLALDKSQAMAEKRLRIDLSKQRESTAYGALTEAVVSEQYHTIASLKQQVQDLEAALIESRSRVGTGNTETLLCFGQEKNLYPGEQQAILANVLSDALKTCENGSRRQHVLASLLEANQCRDIVTEKRQALKKYLKGFSRMDSASRRKLQDLGFTIDSGSSHHHLCFYGDPRYCAVLPKTGSDNRGGLNTALDICRRML